MPDFPSTTNWYVKASTEDVHAEGTAVAIRLRQHGREGSERTYLLTCAHVIRQAADKPNQLGPRHREIRVWPPGFGYNPSAGIKVEPVLSPLPVATLAPTNFYTQPVPVVANADWALLNFVDDTFANLTDPNKLVCNWKQENPQVGDSCVICGFPGGAAAFSIDHGHDGTVSPRLPYDSVAIRSLEFGVIQFQGTDSRAGMSGGGAFCKDGDSFAFVGLHRARADYVQQLHAVSASHILARLNEVGFYSISQANTTNGGPPPKLKRACISQTVGEPASNTQSRAERIVQELIRPVCKSLGFEAIRTDELPLAEGGMTEPVISPLFKDPLVIADLGAYSWERRAWDCDRLLEIGYRLASGRPLVIVADKASANAPRPIHLSDREILFVDSGAPQSSRASLTQKILSQTQLKGHGWLSHYAYIDFQIPLGDDENGTFTYANKQAARIYGLDRPEDMIGKPVNELDARMFSFMSEPHRNAFLEDQGRIGQLVFKPDFKGRIRVEVPLWFTNHPIREENTKVYLPLLGQHRFDQNGQCVLMRTMYVEITSWAWAKEFPQQGVLRIPELFRQDRNRYLRDFFLAYDSKDAPSLVPVKKRLARLRVPAWISEPDADEFTDEELATEIANSRLLTLPVGRNGIGKWASGPLVHRALIDHISNRRPYAFLLLPELGSEAHEQWMSRLPKDIRTVVSRPLYVPLPAEDAKSDARHLSFWDRIIRLLVDSLRLDP